MNYCRTVQLADGAHCLLRSPNIDDARAILQHMIQTSGESDNLLRYPDEIRLTTAQEGALLAKTAASGDAAMICAVLDGCIVANAGLTPAAAADKCRHRAEFGISVQREFWGRGIGALLLSAALELARQAGYEQVELDVVADNRRAIALYQRLGFVRFGTNPHGFRRRDGQYQALELMVCYL